MPEPRRAVRIVAVAMAAVLVGAATWFAVNRVTTEGEPKDDRAVPKGRPNVIMIMTDDQTLESLRVMDRTKQWLVEGGTSFDNYAVSFPNCCPSRAAYLTGQYAHNNGVLDNVPPEGGWRRLKAEETLPVWLHRAGYYTAHVGKYLNGWGSGGDIAPPPGWDRWYGLIDPSTYKYFGFEISDQGSRKIFGDSVDQYSTDVLADEAVRLIADRADDPRPYFLSFTPLAPHNAKPEVANGHKVLSTPVAPPRYAARFDSVPPPRTASYDEADVSDKPADVRREPLNPADERYIARYYHRELAAVLGLDDAVGRIMDELRRTGQLDNTVVLFTSDNGLFHGEHRLRTGKYYLYEPAVHLPLMIRGGPFEAGERVEQAASNVDLAPTILALAGARSALPADGRDLAPMAKDPDDGADRGVLLENQRAHGEFRTWGIRTSRWKYLEHRSGEKELYDLKADPDETTNLVDQPATLATQGELAKRLAVLERCKGATCER